MGIIKFLFFLIILAVLFFIELKRIVKHMQKKTTEDTETEKICQMILRTKPFVLGGIVAIAVILGVYSSIFVTNEQQVGFTSTFGKNTIIEGAGIHLKAPFVSEKHLFDATTKGMAIGYTEENNETQSQESLMITSDFNFINIDFYLEYRITDPIEYYYGSSNPEELLRNIAQSSIRNTVGQYEVDAVMTTGKSEIEVTILESIVNELGNHKTGITITNITIQDAEPPTQEVAKAFQEVEDAKQNADTAFNQAQKYTNEKVPAAEAKAEAVKQAADAAKTERINAAKEEVATFEALYKEYQNNPNTVKNRMYFDALKEILPNLEVIIGKDSKVVYVTGDATDAVKSSDETKKD